MLAREVAAELAVLVQLQGHGAVRGPGRGAVGQDLARDVEARLAQLARDQDSGADGGPAQEVAALVQVRDGARLLGHGLGGGRGHALRDRLRLRALAVQVAAVEQELHQERVSVLAPRPLEHAAHGQRARQPRLQPARRVGQQPHALLPPRAPQLREARLAHGLGQEGALPELRQLSLQGQQLLARALVLVPAAQVVRGLARRLRHRAQRREVLLVGQRLVRVRGGARLAHEVLPEVARGAVELFEGVLRELREPALGHGADGRGAPPRRSSSRRLFEDLQTRCARTSFFFERAAREPFFFFFSNALRANLPSFFRTRCARTFPVVFSTCAPRTVGARP